MELNIIQKVLLKAIKEYELVSTKHETDVLVAFISVDLIREHLNPSPVLNPVKTVDTASRRRVSQTSPTKGLQIAEGETHDKENAD